MKKMTNKMIALFMTLLMVAAMLPITASADNCYMALVELNEPYFGENLSEIFPEVEIEVGFPVLYDGSWFILYYNAFSVEDAEAIAEKLKINPFVKNLIYAGESQGQEPVDTAGFLVTLTPLCVEDTECDYTVNIAKLFPEIPFSKVEKYAPLVYNVYCDVNVMEEAYLIYDELMASPFVSELYYYYNKYNNIAAIGSLDVTLKNTYTADEVKSLFPELEIVGVSNIYATQYRLIFREKTLRMTFEAGRILEESPYVVEVKYGSGITLPAVAPEEIDESYYKPVERSEVTVETALAALRITAGLSEVKNGVYDFRLADAIWQYDCDGDKVITVTDALFLLRTAAGLAA